MRIYDLEISDLIIDLVMGYRLLRCPHRAPDAAIGCIDMKLPMSDQ
jgi:hypothetical protein